MAVMEAAPTQVPISQEQHPSQNTPRTGPGTLVHLMAVLKVAPTLAPIPQGQHPRPKNSRENLTALFVTASTPVLLQRAQALTYKPGHSAVKRKARLILDTGSQRTYVSTRSREHLRLPTESSERIPDSSWIVGVNEPM